ncbi:MAG: glycosyltransferase family 4 protein [Planctomycetes bacterium]|nr:glycosyltransferase family 4 protein [Planctomycetota bacterium]
MAIRVLHVIDHLGLGGGQASTKSIVENVDKKQFEISVCALRAKPETIPIDSKIITLTYGRFDPRTVFAIAKLCKEQKIDILHAQLDKAIITCLLASFICKAGVVIHERGGISRKSIASPLYRFMLRIFHRRAAAIIANSQAIALELTNKASVENSLIKIIYNPVDFKFFDAEKISRKQARKDLGIADDDFVVGYVGRLHTVKGIDILLETFSSLLSESPRYLLVLAGDGPLRQELEQLAQKLGITNRTRFLGMCNNIPEIMSAFDVGVNPSNQKSFGKTDPRLQLNWGGRVAVEFMRMKVPIVFSGKDGPSEIITDEQTGLLVHEDSPEEIAESIRRLASDDNLRKKLIENAFKTSEQFNVGEHVRKIESIYKEITASLQN